MIYEDYIFYPATKTNGELVHKNLLNIFNEEELEIRVRVITELKLLFPKEFPKGDFNKNLLLKYNKYLFGDIFPFAGKIKKWNLGKGQEILGGYSVRYCPVQFIESSIDDCCNQLKALKKETPIENLAKQIADGWAYLWQIHPFYEGNTRTTALFMIELLKSKGIEFNEEVMAKKYHDFRNALVLYSVQQEDKLNNLIWKVYKQINKRYEQ